MTSMKKPVQSGPGSTGLIPGVVLALAGASAVQAHNLYVLIGEGGADGGTAAVDVIFEHSPYPGKGTYNQPHLDRGETWAEGPGGKEIASIDLEEVTRLGKRFLQGQTSAPRPRAIIHSCLWGVYKGRLDFFHGKYLDASSAEDVAALARTERLPLDLVVTPGPQGLKVTVLYEGKPQAGKKIWVWSPDGKTSRQVAGEDGSIQLTGPAAGLYCFATFHTREGPAGEFEGQPYEGIMHGTTVSLRWTE